MSGTSGPDPIVAELVETMRKLAGSHPGYRPVHAKGLVCAGTFRATAEAKRISRAAHLQGQGVAAIVRFANSSGNPDVHDGQPSVRSLAVKLKLADGKIADILANSVDGFVARTPAEFLEFLRTQLPDPATGKPASDALPKFLGSHPAAAAFVGRLMQKPVPASYAQTSYHAEHAFRFTAADGTSAFGRYHVIPEAGETYLSPEDGAKRGANFLCDELQDRLRRGPVSFRLQLQIAGPGDPTDDVTALWPEDSRRVELGRLEITGIAPTGPDDEKRLVFDPSNCPDGIEMSNDPILQARSAAYSISYGYRSRNQ